jgi:hypothetical protein
MRVEVAPVSDYTIDNQGYIGDTRHCSKRDSGDLKACFGQASEADAAK